MIAAAGAGDAIREVLSVSDSMREYRRLRARDTQCALIDFGIDEASTRGSQLHDYALSYELVHYLRASIGSADTRTQPETIRQSAREYVRAAEASLAEFGSLHALSAANLAEDQCMFQGNVVISPLPLRESMLMQAASTVLSQQNLAECVAESVGVVVSLGVVAPGDPIATWATGVLPYVVHLHLMPRSELVARDLIHEATHNYLNDRLAMDGVQLDATTPAFWSPWKVKERPLFGFVHSIFAFSVVTTFLSGILADESQDWAWLRRFRDTERARLAQCRDSVDRACTMLPQRLANQMAEIFRIAVI